MSESTESLAKVLWNMAQAAARDEFGDRISALEQDVASLREAAQTPRPVEPQSIRA